MSKASDRKPADPKVMPRLPEQPAAMAGEGQITWGGTGNTTTPATPQRQSLLLLTNPTSQKPLTLASYPQDSKMSFSGWCCQF